MRALNIENPNQLSVISLPDPKPGDNEVLIRVRASGICDTDVHILRGEYLGAYPVIPGHEFSGDVEAVGKRVTRFKVGDKVVVEPNIACDNCVNCLNNRHNFCLNRSAVGVTLPGGMAELVCAPEKAVFDIGDLSYEAAAFVEPLSCVLHGIERARLSMGDKVAILGAGPIGQLLMQAARLQGAAHITLVDKNITRLNFGCEGGADVCLNRLDALDQDAYDVVIDATGSPAVMKQTTQFARYGGSILLFGVPPNGARLELDAFAIFRKGLTLLSSFTSMRNSYQAMALLRSGQINVADMVSHRLALEEFEHGVELIEKGLENVRKVQIIPAP